MYNAVGKNGVVWLFGRVGKWEILMIHWWFQLWVLGPKCEKCKRISRIDRNFNKAIFQATNENYKLIREIRCWPRCFWNMLWEEINLKSEWQLATLKGLEQGEDKKNTWVIWSHGIIWIRTLMWSRTLVIKWESEPSSYQHDTW